MWKEYYIENIKKKILNDNITISLCSEIKNKYEIIYILTNINTYKHFFIKSDIDKNLNTLYCNGIIFNTIFKSSDKYYNVIVSNDSNDNNKNIFIKIISYSEYNNYTEFISESYIFGYDVWKEDLNLDFDYYIKKLDWILTLEDFYNLDLYNKIKDNDNIKIIKGSAMNTKVCYFNKISSEYYYYFHHIFFIKLLNDKIILLDIIEEDDNILDNNIKIKIIEYNSINEYFQTKTFDIYSKTYGNTICKIINYQYYIP